MKKYLLIAGINGSGKSTLYQTQKNWMNMPRINTDEIVNKLGDWNDITCQMKAGKMAVSMIHDYFKNNISFQQETTLCGNSILNNISRAIKNDYFVEMHYISVNSPSIANERIKYRVAHGGHGIPEEIVIKRYKETFINLKKVLPLCNLISLYDNTDSFRRFAIYKNGELVRLSRNLPEWYKSELLDLY